MSYMFSPIRRKAMLSFFFFLNCTRLFVIASKHIIYFAAFFLQTTQMMAYTIINSIVEENRDLFTQFKVNIQCKNEFSWSIFPTDYCGHKENVQHNQESNGSFTHSKQLAWHYSKYNAYFSTSIVSHASLLAVSRNTAKWSYTRAKSKQKGVFRRCLLQTLVHFTFITMSVCQHGPWMKIHS